MKRSSPLRALVLATTLGLLATSCSLFTVPPDVDVRKITVDLAFGGEPPKTFTPPPPPPLGGPPVIDEPPTTDEEPEKPQPPLCPPTSAVAPDDPAVASIGFDHEPEQGNYLFRWIGNQENNAPFGTVGYKTIENVQATTEGFTFTLNDGFTRARWTFEARPISDTSQTGGLFLTRLDLPEGNLFDPTARVLPFEPEPPLQLLSFPIQSGSSITAEGVDTAPKAQTGVTDPITGAPILAPSANSMTMETLVGSTERFEVCEDLAQAWKVNIDLEIAGQYNVHLLGSLWLATQYGGWPIRSDYVVSGDLMAGNYADSLMKIKPGDYL